MPALAPPIAPMLAELARELPRGAYLYEPKWDGFRCLAFVERGQVVLHSRHGKPLTRYFPEVVAALAAAPRGFVLDGELVIPRGDGHDFAALMSRTHPAASRVARLAAETPATLIGFDLLADGDQDLTRAPFSDRRGQLEALLAHASPRLRVTEATRDAEVAARWLRARAGRGIDGVVAKPLDLVYQPGQRAMIKVKPVRTVDCVVAGFRLAEDGALGSLLLGLWDGPRLRHVGVVSQLTRSARRELALALRREAVPLEGHPWQHGVELPSEPTLDWIPVAPSHVAEVSYGHADGQRFRHPARLVRWRPDREARSCTVAQLP